MELKNLLQKMVYRFLLYFHTCLLRMLDIIANVFLLKCVQLLQPMKCELENVCTNWYLIAVLGNATHIFAIKYPNVLILVIDLILIMCQRLKHFSPSLL